jgi:hypothetical protein
MKKQGSIRERKITGPAFSMHPELGGQVMETMRKRVKRKWLGKSKGEWFRSEDAENAGAIWIHLSIDKISLGNS